MKSITACPHCSTQFLVDDEQLSQYKGKVRCGHCLNVFNAVDYFIQNEPEESAAEPVESKPTEATETHAEVRVEADTAAPESTQETTIQKPVDKPIETPVKDAPETVSEDLPSIPVFDEAAAAIDSPEDERVDQAFIDKTQSLIENINVDQFKVDIDPEANIEPAVDSIVGSEEPRFSIEPDTVLNAQSGSVPMMADSGQSETNNDYADYDLPPEPNFSADENLINTADSATDDDTAPDFYLEEKKPTPFWVKLLILLFILAMLGQLIYFMRDNIAQLFPETKPVLQNLCKPLGCEINLPKEIQLFSIDDSGIQEDADRQGVIRLTSTITNRADFNQAYPDLEVTLTDTKDKPKIRRVFKSTEYLPKTLTLADGIAPGESVSIDMPLMTDDVKVAGFRILLTYNQ